MNLPPEPLPVTPFLDPITDAELAAHGGLKRTIVMRVDRQSNPPPGPGQSRSPAPRRPRSCNRRRVNCRTGSTRPAARRSPTRCTRSARPATTVVDQPGPADDLHSVPVIQGADATRGARQRGGVDDRQHEQHPPSVSHPRQSDVHRRDERGAGRAVLGRHDRVAVQRRESHTAQSAAAPPRLSCRSRTGRSRSACASATTPDAT